MLKQVAGGDLYLEYAIIFDGGITFKDCDTQATRTNIAQGPATARTNQQTTASTLGT